MKASWTLPGDNPGDWQEIRVEFDRVLVDAEVWQAAGCIGYALRQQLHGEDLSEPRKIKRKGGKTIVRFGYDSTKSRSDDPDEVAAFELAALYVQEGSPVRKTDRAGKGTAGTRLCQGLGSVRVRFWVR